MNEFKHITQTMEERIRFALQEDVGSGDATTDAISLLKKDYTAM
jgi:nicotinate-nucleotide pyrophosphorylase